MEITVVIDSPSFTEALLFTTNQLSGRAALGTGQYSISAWLQSSLTLGKKVRVSNPVNFSLIDPEVLPEDLPTSPIEATRIVGPHFSETVDESRPEGPARCWYQVIVHTHAREGSGTDGGAFVSPPFIAVRTTKMGVCVAQRSTVCKLSPLHLPHALTPGICA